MPDVGNERPGRAGSAGPLAPLAHPVTVASLVVLVVNDHVLKSRYPGVLTGKLSDVAGLVLLPAVFVAVVGVVGRAARGNRQPATAAVVACVAVTGVGFVLVKTMTTAAAAASALWSVAGGPSQIRADVTDLVALPALGLALWVGLGGMRADERSRRPARRAGALVTLFLLPASTLAIAATSAPTYNDAVTVHARGTAVIAGETLVYGTTQRSVNRTPVLWKVSDDGGNTWRRLDREDLGMNQAQENIVHTQGCVPQAAQHCYRVVPGHLEVEETVDGGTSWRRTWAVTDEQRRRLARDYPYLGDVVEYLSSRALAVVAAPGGHVVVVANGRDGYAVRSADGRWNRIGFGALHDDGVLYSDPPVPLRGRTIRDVAPEVAGGILIGVLAMIVAYSVALWRDGRRWPTAAALPPLAFGSLIILAAARGLRDTDDWFDFVGVAAGAILIAATTLGLLIGSGASGAMRPRLTALVALIGLATAAIGVGAFAAWGGGVLGYRAAGLTAVVVATFGLAMTMLVVTRPDINEET